MTDPHSCSHDHSAHLQGKALNTALIVAFIFMFIELVGGIVANSLALISDALHMFTDAGALFLSLIVLKITQKPRTPKMSYGYHRAEILGALASALSLWVLCGVLIYESIHRLFAPEPVKGPIVFVIATIGLVANLYMMRVLHPTQGHSLNVRAAYLHVLGDLLGSVGVIIGGALLWFTNYYPIDPIISILFALGIVYGSGKIIKQSIVILMESVPGHIDAVELQKDLESLEGVQEVHDLHIWAVSPKIVALSAHIIASDPQQSLNDAHALIQDKYQISHMTIQAEDPAHFDRRFCYDCDK